MSASSTTTTSATICNVAILGYYHKQNAGDDAFQTVFESILNPKLYKLTFINPSVQLQQDANWTLPEGTDCVIVGGGDLINDHFMPPIRKLLIQFQGPRLAIGVGISYPDCAGYLKCFDYVIVRSQADYVMAQPFVSAGFLEVFPDLTYFMDRKSLLKSKPIPVEKTDLQTIRIGLCIAEPCLATAHEHGKTLVESLALVMENVVEKMKQSQSCDRPVEWILIPFNTNEEKEFECDWNAINRLADTLNSKPNTSAIFTHLPAYVTKSPTSLFDYFVQQLDFVVGMRYHSIMFAIVSGTPFVALYSTPKIGNLLQYLAIDNTDVDHRMEYISGESHIPSRFDTEKLTCQILLGLQERVIFKKRLLPHNQTTYAARIRKLIHSKPQFPSIPQDTGYDIKFPDEHHLNRLAYGTMRQYLGPLQEEVDIDAILDGKLALEEVKQAECAGTAAKDISTLLLSRLHNHKYTVDTHHEEVQPEEMISTDRAEIYLDGFQQKIYDKTTPLREQLAWITMNYYRNLHPIQPPLPPSSE